MAAMPSTRSTVTFPQPFILPGYPDELPAGDYDILVEEELLGWLSFAAHRRTATYLAVPGKGRFAGRTELRPINMEDLETALGQGGDPASEPSAATHSHRKT